MYENNKSPYSSTLRTFDSTNYNSIGNPVLTVVNYHACEKR